MSETIPSSNSCPKCGAALPSAPTSGLCPRCLLAEALLPTQPDAEACEPGKTLAPEELAPHFPQLEILECLGRGGMGVVYQARQKTLNRFVALKLLAPERVHDAKFAERFTREAQALAALNHPHIVTIHDFGQAGGFYFLLMEFVDGVNLRQLLRQRKLTPEEALAIVPPLCDALQFAHDRGIVHRDIKPENLLLDKDGRLKVADFGIAKMLGSVDGEGDGIGAPENATQSTVGTPAYSAPEQKTDPQRVDRRADIYSLGVVFYEMLTGELPGHRLEPPSRKVQIDVRLDEVVLRALEQNQDLRYQQVSEVKTMVETIVATPDSGRRRSDERHPENRKLAIVPRFSRPALVGVGFGALGMVALVLYAAIGDSNLLDEGPSTALAALGALSFLVSTILGWVAVSQIRSSAPNVHGMWLAVFDGLLFPLLVLNGLLAFLAGAIVQTFSTIVAVIAQATQNGIHPGSAERFAWLAGIATVFICALSNTLIAWRVWRMVHKGDAGAPLGGSENSAFRQWACGPLLVATIGPSLVLAMVPWYEGVAEGLMAATGSMALAMALVWGLRNWRKRSGKFVVLAPSALGMALLLAAAVLSFVTIPARRARLQAAFGPVTEITLPMDEDGWTPLFDLDRNESVPDPTPGGLADGRVQHLAQLMKPGLAIHHDSQTHLIAVSGMTIHNTDGDGDQWKQITDLDFLAGPAGFGFLSTAGTVPGGNQTIEFPDQFPVTLFFKTGLTKLGLLQITGFTEHPRRVKLRYKLVPNGRAPATNAAAGFR